MRSDCQEELWGEESSSCEMDVASPGMGGRVTMVGE